MLYTRKGDNGTTGLFGCNQRLSKSSNIAEALGAVDELNSLLGLIRSFAETQKFFIKKRVLSDIILSVQEDLFIIQAELAGADKHLKKLAINKLEQIIAQIESELAPIKSFLIPGSSELSAYLDLARAVSRRAERRVVLASEEGQIKIKPHTLAYLNRLSSLLYALARLLSQREGAKELKPSYK